MSRRRSVRPRLGRVALVAASCVVTAVAVLGGVGALPSEREPAAALAGRSVPVVPTPMSPPVAPSVSSVPAAPASPVVVAPATDPGVVPADSGAGRRVVFSEDAQRVWLVGAAGVVRRTYLVSGSVTDNLHPGTYEVWSRSRWAVGIDDSGVMEYFVRFAHGRRAAIGFHSIPTKDDRPLQTRAQLGTPQSHGCIRQALPDAVAMWRFASAGTTVVVV
jgi:lipoprotein-anchoring transpeptidase ErfK/SrfK